MLYLILFLTFTSQAELGNSNGEAPESSIRPQMRRVAPTDSRICISGDEETRRHARYQPTEASLAEYTQLNRTDRRNTPHPRYEAYLRSLRASSGSDIVARLAYAELKEAKCDQHIELIRPVILESIYNRLETRKTELFPGETRPVHELNYQLQKRLVESVVFQHQQYASSLHRYRISPRSESPVRVSDGYQNFLCPPQDELFGQIKGETDEYFRSGQRTREYPSDMHNYYLYEHAPEVFTTLPEWADYSRGTSLPEATTSLNADLRRCYRAFREPAYR